MFVGGNAFLYAKCLIFVALAGRLGLPAIYEGRNFVDAGGLMSYEVDFADVYRRAGNAAARIPRGAKPADFPVKQPSSKPPRHSASPSRRLIRAEEVIE